MSELRWLPAAAVAWVAMLSVAHGLPLLALIFTLVAAAVAWHRRVAGQMLMVTGVGLAATLRALIPPAATTIVSARPTQTRNGSWRIELGQRHIMVDELPRVEGFRTLPPGTHLFLQGDTILSTSPPTGWAAFAAKVNEHLINSVNHFVGPSSQGLIPGMVLGDTSLQSPADKEIFLVTGLSHLSAVSGANISVVTTAAAILVAALGLGPRWQFTGAMVAMALFVGLVGPQPSVLRAAVTGAVSLVAVVSSSRMQPIHALTMGVVGLLLVQPHLAVEWGFALSVAATAGLVMLSPYLYRALAVLGLPDILTRALAVALAADASTAPLIALMSGEISVVGVLANILVAPATAPVTIVGLAGIGIPPLLVLAQPFTWWIYHIAYGCAALPFAPISASALLVACVYAWIFVGLSWRPKLTMIVVPFALAAAAWHPGGAIDSSPASISRGTFPVVSDFQRANNLDSEEDIGLLPPGTDGIVVLDEGPPHAYPSRTADGVPVVYPLR